jgi:hypothetical protein
MTMALAVVKEAVVGRRKKRPRRPKLICVDGRVVAEAVVIVSPKDRNWWRASGSGGAIWVTSEGVSICLPEV